RLRAYPLELEEALSNYAKSLRAPYRREYPRRWNARRLSGCEESLHAKNVIDRSNSLNPGGVDSVSHFKRLDPQGQSTTLRAGTGRDHGSFTAARPIHPTEPRVITVREAARLQSLPDWFQLHTTRWHGLRQIGNSVPPRL